MERITGMLAVVALLPPVARPEAVAPLPDLLPPGHRAVRHELLLDVPVGTQAPVLVAFPTSGFTVARRVVPGEPFPFSSKYGTRLYVLLAGEVMPRKVDAGWCERHRSVAIPVVERTSVPMASPVVRVRTTLRAAWTEAGVLQIDVVATEQFDAADRPIDPWRDAPWLLLPSCGGVLWLWLLSRRRRRRQGGAR